MTFHDYALAIHVHSVYSHDGRVSVDDIINAAEETNLNGVLLTDHESLAAKDREGWNGEILLIVGQEISPRLNHYLAFGTERAIPSDEKEEEIDPQYYIDEVKAQGGIGFIAHPDHEGTKLFHVKQFPWKDWSVYNYEGLSIWDFMTDWQSVLTNHCRALVAYLFPAYMLQGPRQLTLQRWDALNQKTKITGIGELDNHDTPFKFLGVSFNVFPFRRVFPLIRTHVLLEYPFTRNGKADAAAVLTALRQGRAYVAMDYFYDAKGFEFVIKNKNDFATMGDELLGTPDMVLSVKVPKKGKIRIIKDGKIFTETVGFQVDSRLTERGVYRVEAYCRIWRIWKPWIFSNPIYVR